MNAPFIPCVQAEALLDWVGLTGALTARHSLTKFTRAADDITLFKNGSGAHLDLTTSRSIPDRWCRQ